MPSKLTPTSEPFHQPLLLARICEELAKGRSLRSVCRDEGTPDRQTVADWIEKWPEAVGRPIARARSIGEEELLESVGEIVGDRTLDPQARKVEAWGIMEMLKRMNPKRWGDQPAAGPTVTVGVAVNVVTEEELREAQARKRASIERRLRAQSLNPASGQDRAQPGEIVA